MVSIDIRSRFEGDAVALEPKSFFDEDLAALLASRGVAAARAIEQLGLSPLTLMVDDEALSLVVRGRGSSARLVGEHGAVQGAIQVTLDAAAFSDLMQDVVSAFGVHMTGRAQLEPSNVSGFVAWEPVLRWVLDGRPVYEPGMISFADRTGAPLDLHQSFSLDDDSEAIGHFLAEAGYLHVRAVFTEVEMAEVIVEHDAALARSQRDDGASWWARTSQDEWFAARILGFNQQSPKLRELLHSERFTKIGTFTDDVMMQRDPDRGDSAEALMKKVGVVEGISDVSWHKDCSMGGHSRHCCGLVVGISVTGGGRGNGELGVVAGSHRANVVPLGIVGLDLPRIPLPTQTGDITVHCACTLHMSRPPETAERRVIYTGFGLATRAGDVREVRTEEEIRFDRAALNDHTRRQQSEGGTGERLASFDL